MAVEINVEETPVVDPIEESEETLWQSALLEVSNALRSGFDQLRQESEIRESKSQELIQTLLQSHTNLTQQITEANNRMVDLLTLKPSPEPVVIVETPLTDTQNLEEDAIDLSEALPEPEPVAAPRKRRTL